MSLWALLTNVHGVWRMVALMTKFLGPADVMVSGHGDPTIRLCISRMVRLPGTNHRSPAAGGDLGTLSPP